MAPRQRDNEARRVKLRTTEQLRDDARANANQRRDDADRCARMYGGCDDPMHPFHVLGLYRDWLDFAERVCRPIVESDGDDYAPEVQEAMALYRKVSPYSIAAMLVIAANTVAAKP